MRGVYYKPLIDFEYRSQNKRGGRPMVIKIPAGAVGTKMGSSLVFHSLRRRGHNPFIFWHEAWDKVQSIKL